MAQEMKMTKKTSNRFKSFLFILYHVFKNFILFFVPNRLMPKNFKNVNDQCILITGGGSGIGQLMVMKFLKLGAKVIIWDVNVDNLDRTRQMAKGYDEKLFCYRIDLCQKDSIYETAKQVQNDVGPVDILINNAGVVTGKNILDLSDEQIQRTMNVNVISHFFTIRAFLPRMIERKSGHIVTIASLAGELGVALLTDYCASKFAAIGMEQSLHFELAKANLDSQIKTTIVKPWLITTGMFSGAHSGLIPMFSPEYVAQKIVEAILLEKSVLVLPWYLEYMGILLKIFPSKCLIPIYDFLGGFESMDNFTGR
ncbi:hypothetical protein DERF_007408 [Dermatophagoides farinae]|uniref:Short-chain dehydrogenase/reductase 3 n=1 Tax=Dermatophagoides farinae TaxID=6954 RepID=A0A922I190_DERFA|nr:hypothetical protein DERF_007408 [Dermatophagoides farinae]